MPAATANELRADFFDWLFEQRDGYVCLGYARPENPRESFAHRFFHWPSQKAEINAFCFHAGQKHHLWFAVNLMSRPELDKKHSVMQNVLWSDLDTANPADIEPKPSIVIVSSQGRYQALWKTSVPLAPDLREEYSKRIAYKYNTNGADPTGWDLVQLLRVPFSTNFKYNDKPLVLLEAGESDIVDVNEFENIQKAPQSIVMDDDVGDMPDIEKLDNTELIVADFAPYLDNSFFELYELVPRETDDWSARMWKLLNLCIEAGMTPEQTFAIGIQAKCNKHIRDGRPIRHLWLEVLKANKVQKKVDLIVGEWQPLTMPRLVDDEDCEHDTFIDRYRKWAANATDAVEIYHELACAILLSATLSDSIKLEVNYETIVPNLWGMILGESTLTRKTTAMKMAMKFLNEIDENIIVATDGTAEGLMQRLSERPGRVSLFYKDEVSGFFDGIRRKDYLAAMPETLTQLYDGQTLSRMLRKEQIVVRDPIFIFFGGGIAERTYSFLDDGLVYSGFLPRFLVVNGYSDLSRLRPTSAPINQGVTQRESLLSELQNVRDLYSVEGYVTIADQRVPLGEIGTKPKTDVIPTQECWDRIAEIEMKLVSHVSSHFYADLALPTFERMSTSIQKLAMLLAAMRQKPKDYKISMEVRDINNAARFIQDWGRFSIELILNAGKSQNMRLLEKVRSAILRKPGIMRSDLMRMYHLSSPDMSTAITALIERGEISRKHPKGQRSEQYWII